MRRLLERARRVVRRPDGRAIIGAVTEILDRQHAIESRSYDAKTGVMAVAAARRVLASLPVETSGSRQVDLVLDALERLKQRQAANAGEFATGAATIGSIIRDVRTRFRP
ncbi:hypothetical protein AB7M35_004602 [Amorphus suaedae]